MTSHTLTLQPCMHCGKRARVTITDEEYRARIVEDQLIDVAMPNREASFRELFITGIHPECWKQMFPEED
jgi:hypothetical protein